MRRASLLILGAATLASAPTYVRAQDLVTIRVGTPGADANAMVYYAQEMGFFRKLGLDAQITKLPKGSGSAVNAAVIGGALDVGEADVLSLSAAYEHGVGVALLAGSAVYTSSAPTTELIVAKDGSIKTAADLNGSTVAVLSLVGPTRVAFAAWMERSGGDASSVKFVEFAASEMGAAVARGAVAAAMINEPALGAALGTCRVLAPAYDAIGKKFLFSAWFTTQSWIKKNPLVARKFASAMRETAAWANAPANHQRSAEILAGASGLPVAVISASTRATYAESIDVRSTQALIDAAVRYKSLERTLDLRSMIADV
jgi:NitT/TauT family transport system substrate-binding protein